MSKIDYNPNSAPLPGVGRPTVAEISAYLRSPPETLWSAQLKGRKTQASKTFKRSLGGALGLSLLIVIVVSSITPQKTGFDGAMTEIIVPEKTRTLYVVSRRCSLGLINALNMLHSRGVDVRLVSADAAPKAVFQLVTTAPDSIKTEGAMIDGTRWVPFAEKGGGEGGVILHCTTGGNYP
jgi:hypothetical protein